MIDLHAHILPGLDDGARDLEEALEMCRIAWDDGITAIVATPHSGNGVYENGRQSILPAVKQLKACLVQQNIPIEVLPGADVYIRHDLVELLRVGAAITVNVNGRYVLVEFPHHIMLPRYIEWLFKIRLQGITPIFTHPERHTAIQKDIDPVRQWVSGGGLVQITAMSFTGDFGPEAARCAKQLVRNRLVHAIASDAHSKDRRPPLLSHALRAAKGIVDAGYAEKLVNEFPAAIVAGIDLEMPEPVAEPKGLFSKVPFLRRY